MNATAAGISGIRVLEERHMISVMLYLLNHGGCRKTDIYRDLCRTSRFPEKLDLLESNGLISTSLIVGNSVAITLTGRGVEVARRLAEIDDLMTDTDT